MTDPRPILDGGTTGYIGGPKVLPYRELMRIMTEELARRRRPVIPMPVLTPRPSAFWIHLVKRISHHSAAPLVEGLRSSRPRGRFQKTLTGPAAGSSPTPEPSAQPRA